MVEYALLAALVVLISWPALNAIQPALKEAYLRWNTAEQDFWLMPVCEACK